MVIFRRLLGFLRPYRAGVAWSFALAFGAMVMTVVIPFLTGQAINSIRGHSRDQTDLKRRLLLVCSTGGRDALFLQRWTFRSPGSRPGTGWPSGHNQ